MSLSDEALALQVVNGDLSAFEELVNRHQRSVFKIAYRMVGQKEEAEDLAQEVFIHVYQKMYLFNTSKSFVPWLYRVAVNTCISRLRRKQKVVFLSFDDALAAGTEFMGSSIVSPDLNLERQELHNEISRALLKMPEGYRAMIILRYQLDLNNREIAEVLGITKENVEVRMHRAHKLMRQLLAARLSEGRVEREVQASG